MISRRNFLATSAALGASSLAAPAIALSRPDVIIGWTTWSDAEVVTKIAARVLRAMGKDVELTLADIDAQFRTMANGDIDVMLMSWEPGLHAPYLRRHGDSLVDLGIIYEGNIGLAVPGWVNEDFISSIEDLNKPDVKAALGGRIVGIDPGAGLTATTKDAISQYGLDYTLEEGTGPKMVREIAKASRNEDPIVVTAWRPHAKFALYDMRYLDDPKGLYADISEIHGRAHKDFPDRQPEIAAILRNMTMDVLAIETIMVQARDMGFDAAVDAWIEANGDTIASWMP